MRKKTRRIKIGGLSRVLIVNYENMKDVERLLSEYRDGGFEADDLGEFRNIGLDVFFPDNVKGVYLDEVMDFYLENFKAAPPFDFSMDYFRE